MIPMARPEMGPEEIEAVRKVMESGMLAHGPEVEMFEEEFARFCGVEHAATVSSGTSAIHLALASLDIGPGDEVITTAFSFIASATPILFLGAVPRFVDIDPGTFNMDPEKLAEAMNGRTKAIIPVHLYGQCADMDSILEVADGIPVLEDCAQAHGSLYKGKTAGSMGRCGMFSFYPTKNMTTGEGGIVVSDDSEIVDRVRMLRNHGQIARYDHHSIGYNLRMTSIGAAIGRVQLEKLPWNNEVRRRNAKLLTEGLKGIDGITPPLVAKGNDPVFHQYTIKVEKDRDGFSRFLTERGIGNKVFYPSTIPSSPAMKPYSKGEFPVAEEMTRRVISLPVHPKVTIENIEYMLESIRDAVERIGK
ncbi:MAG: DegT/DnrJ/EryC1/StrS family aminotransferase [Thermoplasmatota archaeon]